MCTCPNPPSSPRPLVPLHTLPSSYNPRQKCAVLQRLEWDTITRGKRKRSTMVLTFILHFKHQRSTCLGEHTHGLSGFLFVPDYCDLFDGGHTLSATSVIRQIVAYKVNVKNCDSAAWKCGYVGDISVNDYLWLKSKGTCGWEMNEKENLVRATKVRYSIKWIGINHPLTNPGFILVQKEMKYLSVNQLLG